MKRKKLVRRQTKVSSFCSSGRRRKVISYALAGGIAFGAPAISQATIVHTNPADIERGTGLPGGSTYTLDLNGVGDDFTFSVDDSTSILDDRIGVDITKIGGNTYIDSPGGGDDRVGLVTAGTEIGPAGPWDGGDSTDYLLENTKSGDSGLWANDWDQLGQYIGLRFDVGGNTHYGWVQAGAELSSGDSSARFRLFDWAYENVPDTAILAGDTGGGNEVPEPSALSMFALGAAGLLALRHRRKNRQAS